MRFQPAQCIVPTALCQDLLSVGSTAVRANAPSAGELKVLRAAARECNTGSVGDRTFSPEAGSRDLSDWIRPAACAAGVVALGKVVSQTSALSADQVNNFRIQALYKSKGKTAIGETLRVLRHAGR
jgi:hypothetical protein